ncbi:methyltransferase domain-containing protein [Oceanicella sp. SM1341]|uniref:methyltransferase domain-containing protein n=1 Tax=Oceanicella sp. SM1341 TaxID=1548889 RepID=UPI000E4B5EA0|nr:methyltransferase domain-containing protein [Oceanicella sp. SM1341]
MHLDVVDLRAFYYRTPLGRRAKTALQDSLRALWPKVKDETVAGFGFTAPMLRPFLAEARRVICLMPGQQGVMPWPPGGPNTSVLTEETGWPLPTGFVDRLVIGHGLETCEQPGALLDEIWRVLAPGGRVVFVLPNRSGLWARRDGTPFGYGRPYSFGQIDADLRRHRFSAERHAASLYFPPSHRQFVLRTAPAWERVGQRVGASRLAGAILVEAAKQVYVLPRNGARESARRPFEILEGLTKPAKPVAGRV